VILEWDLPAYRLTNTAPPVTWWTPPDSDRAHAVLPDGSIACGHPRRDATWRPAGTDARCRPCMWLDARGGPC